MSIHDTDEFQTYYTRIRPIFPLLFNIAHLITGSSDSAEYSIKCAMLDCWLAGENNAVMHGFRESLRSRTIRAAMRSRNDDEEFDWSGLPLNETDTDPIMLQLRKEPIDAQRVLALHYGCGFSARKCASLCNIEPRKARGMIERFRRRMARKLSASRRRRFEASMPKYIRDILSRPGTELPEAAAIFRAFQDDARDALRPSRLPARILRIILTFFLALLCVLGFFLAAVLMQPAVTTNGPASGSSIVETFEP